MLAVVVTLGIVFWITTPDTREVDGKIEAQKSELEDIADDMEKELAAHTATSDEIHKLILDFMANGKRFTRIEGRQLCRDISFVAEQQGLEVNLLCHENTPFEVPYESE